MFRDTANSDQVKVLRHDDRRDAASAPTHEEGFAGSSQMNLGSVPH